MNNNTFESSEHYKVLIGLIDKLSKTSKRKKSNISRIIQNFNKIIKDVDYIKDNGTKNYILDLIKKDYLIKLDNIKSNYNYDEYIISSMKNFIVGKIRFNKEIL